MSMPWREQMRQQNTLRTPALHPVARIFINVFLPNSSSLQTLSFKERYILESVSKNCIAPRSAREVFQSWLQQRERTCMRSEMSTPWLWHQYRTSYLQRIFLQRALTPCIVSVHAPSVLGSYVCAKYLEKEGGCNWHPQDVDIFVCSLELAMHVAALYRVTIAATLGLPVDVTLNKGSMASRYVTSYHEHPFTIPVPDYQLRDQMHVPPSSTSPFRAQFIDMLREECSIACERYRHHPEHARLTDQICDIPSQVPPYFEAAPYDVVCSWKLHVREPAGSTSVLLPINIIVVSVEPTCTDFTQEIANGFDFAHCCLALQVTRDLEYTFHEYNHACVCLQARRLHLRATSFKQNDLSRQVKRIAKYVQRDFTW